MFGFDCRWITSRRECNLDQPRRLDFHWEKIVGALRLPKMPKHDDGVGVDSMEVSGSRMCTPYCLPCYRSQWPLHRARMSLGSSRSVFEI